MKIELLEELFYTHEKNFKTGMLHDMNSGFLGNI